MNESNIERQLSALQRSTAQLRGLVETLLALNTDTEARLVVLTTVLTQLVTSERDNLPVVASIQTALEVIGESQGGRLPELDQAFQRCVCEVTAGLPRT